MYRLIVTGSRRAVLAVHRCESQRDVRELLAVYELLGYAPEALIVEEEQVEQAA
jgi:hypothetical protein